MAQAPILSVKDLSIRFGKADPVLNEIDLELYPNEILGLVGESGSGKSITSLAIMGLLPKTAVIEGEITYEDQRLAKLSSNALRSLRGNEMAMIFQEPMSALNPALKCGPQVAEVLKIHKGQSESVAKKEVLSLFEQVKLPRVNEVYSSYPHQLSGGQMQRVMIAMALACKPKILIADEPTTALDVTVQKEIIELLKSLQKENQMSVLFISHDLALVSEIADRVAVMFRGSILEVAETHTLFTNPQHNYTKALLNSRPDLDKRLKRLPTVDDLSDNSFKPEELSAQQRAAKHKKLYTKAPLLEINNLEKTYYGKAALFGKPKAVAAVKGVNFQVFEGETLGLVGESGCGKSTLGKTIMQIESATAGQIKFRGKDITYLNKTERQRLRKEIQIVFQDPFASLNPRMTIGEAIEEPLRVHHSYSASKRKQEVLELLEEVGLDADYYNRYPHQLSGGQRQRIGIARAIALKPKLLICDESVSALDISVQAQVLNLLNRLKDNYGFTYIFISHDLAVVKYMADQLVVMNAGLIEEIGDADEIYANPKKEYTKRLIDAIPKGLK
ncbi:ABC transporter ATP-binding protein [Gilvibacter sp.]|uniref:ABC transporter ATP-binding protein n=1 Tax=Gilvibacter sp. TaxID=2729997 RepID=UPI0025BA5C2E|nr:ABC transporter ATP-binding protein [Gilvibacter sp.]NQX76252.1 ABC transporter ATP-binding protein [Gilvibacter sp.]